MWCSLGGMPPRKRTKVEPTDGWEQLKLLIDTPEQLTYELIRPVVLFGRSPAQRARETGTASRTIHRRAARFADQGMRILLGPSLDAHRRLAPENRQAILELKAEHLALKTNEISTICFVRFDHRPCPTPSNGSSLRASYPRWWSGVIRLTTKSPVRWKGGWPLSACTAKGGATPASRATWRSAASPCMPPSVARSTRG
jgi:hypothetical protein